MHTLFNEILSTDAAIAVRRLTRYLLLTTVLSTVTSAPQAAPYSEMVPNFKRTVSNVMVRQIAVPTLAALDYAAYTDNPILFEPQRFKPVASPGNRKVSSVSFDGYITRPVRFIHETPLTAAEREQPLAWRPLVKRLWEVVKDQCFSTITAKINGYKWSDPSIFVPYQEITTAYLHTEGTAKQIWVKIEFAPWVRFITNAHDGEKNGFRELYGCLDGASLPPALLDTVFSWIRSEYCTRTLSHEEIIDWVTDLASYWYPAKNTDILPTPEVWPDAATENKVRQTMKNVRIRHPTAVVRGKPFNEPVYNVFITGHDTARPMSAASPTAAVPADRAAVPRGNDSSSALYGSRNSDRFRIELAPYGTYSRWAESVVPLMREQKTFLSRLPSGQAAYEGKAGWLFFRKDLDYCIGGDLSKQEYEKNPLAHIIEFKRYLEQHDVALLFVPVPNKTEVYFEKLPFATADNPMTVINPYSRKILSDLQDSGVEVIDLLTHFLAAKTLDTGNGEPIYQQHDTHWNSRGLFLAADLIAERIKAYRWYNDSSTTKCIFTAIDTTVFRQGDLIERLPESRRADYRPLHIRVKRIVASDGTPFRSGPESPVSLIGDSFTGVLESVDCKSAGVGAAIAYSTGVPVDIITSWGGGPPVRERFIRQRGSRLSSKRLVIYMMVMRDLYNYDQSWTPLRMVLNK